MRTIEGFKSTHLETAAQRKGKDDEPLLHTPLKECCTRRIAFNATHY